MPAVCVVLAAITFVVFGRTAGFEFVNYDDPLYVYENPVVEKGLTLGGAAWALTYGEIGHWHPLTWLTHMADCQLYGVWAGGHHLTNVALHAAAAMLLFLALRELTGSLWRSAFVAAVFATHPLRAESVAWIAEHKDVLSGGFFMLTLWAYARYVRQPSRWRYTGMAAAYALGLLSKNTLVTLPFVLLLLDWWPLQRLTPAAFWRLVKEKIPLFLLSIGSCTVTFLVPEKLLDYQRLPLLERIGNAPLGYGIYLRQMVFPAGLYVPYLYPPNGPGLWKVALVSVLLAAISISVLACRKRRPYLLVGWLWYLGVLIPMIGIIQMSIRPHADRYTYLSGVGLVLAGTWAVAEWSLRWRHRQALLGGLGTAMMGALMVCAWIQTGHWKTGEALWTRTLACSPDNEVACCNLGSLLIGKGRWNEGIRLERQALQADPNYVLAQFNLADALLQKGRLDGAICHFMCALYLQPDYAEAHTGLGLALLCKGKADEAAAHFQEAVRIDPDEALAHCSLGNILLKKGRGDDATTHYERALQINPAYPQAHYNLGNILLEKGRVDDAISHYQQALQINPDYAPARVNLGNALLQKGRVDEAILHYQRALQNDPNCLQAQVNLGSILSQRGKVEEAITQFQQAMRLHPNDPEIQTSLAWLLATCPQASLRNADQAVQLAQRANDQSGGKNPFTLRTLAAAFAEAGRFDAAMQKVQRAIELAQAAGRPDLAGELNAELKRYQAGLPLHP
ncbi:MAG: tetratricopeptide repeat protein [Verrucomicrobiota bacterium]